MRTVKVGNIIAKPGELKLGKLDCGYLPDSSVVAIPLIVVNGAQDGPTLLLTSAMHGPEITGSEVIRRLCREIIDPAKLKGTIIAAPVLNPFGFRHHEMNTPQDGYNLNRVFPGNSEALLSHRLAYIIYNQLVTNSDYIIDFHANPQPAMQFTIIKEGQHKGAWEKSREMARAFGLTTIEMISSYERHRGGTLAESAANDGKAAMILELVSWRRMEEHSVVTGVRGTLNVMKYLGMIEGQQEKQEGVPAIEGRLTRTEITATKGGFVHYLKELGEPIVKGEIIAILRDPWGDIVEEVKSPHDGWVLAWPFLGNQAIATGEIIVMIAFPKE